MSRAFWVGAVVSGLVLGAVPPALASEASASEEWTAESVPSQGQWAPLTTVASGAGQTWAFGMFRNDVPGFHSQTFRRGSRGWEKVETPDIGRVNGSTIVSENDSWAVGDGTSMHWNGEAWAEVPMVAPENTYTEMLGVKAFGPDDVWSAGVVRPKDQSSARGITQHWDGKTWTEIPVPDVADHWDLSSVDGAASDDVWAVGDTLEAISKPVALHWDGRRWTQTPVPMPEGAQSASLRDVLVSAQDDVWAAGEVITANGHARVFAAHWDGNAWTIGETPDEPAAVSDLARVGDALWGVGYNADSTTSFAMRYDGGAWKSVPGPQGSLVELEEAAALSDGGLLAVGSHGGGPSTTPVAVVHGG